MVDFLFLEVSVALASPRLVFSVYWLLTASTYDYLSTSAKWYGERLIRGASPIVLDWRSLGYARLGHLLVYSDAFLAFFLFFLDLNAPRSGSIQGADHRAWNLGFTGQRCSFYVLHGGLYEFKITGFFYGWMGFMNYRGLRICLCIATSVLLWRREIVCLSDILFSYIQIHSPSFIGLGVGGFTNSTQFCMWPMQRPGSLRLVFWTVAATG